MTFFSACRCFVPVTILLLTGCAELLALDPGPRVPVPTDSNVAIVGIAVKARHLLKDETCARGIFVKLDEEFPDDVMRGKILTNTRYDSGHVYLLNAQPGRYAAVGCIVYGRPPLSQRIFFNKTLIARLTRTINPGTVVLLGKITVHVDGISNESQFDEVQQYYFRELRGKDVAQALEDLRFLGHQFPLQGMVGASLDHEYPLDAASQQFLTVLSENLIKAWEPWLNNSRGPGP